MFMEDMLINDERAGVLKNTEIEIYCNARYVRLSNVEILRRYGSTSEKRKQLTFV